MTTATSGVGNRLVEALGEKSLWALHVALTKKSVPGSSYANLRQIRLGNSEPSIGFLAAAASELDVSPAWLAFGAGSKTDRAAIADAGPLFSRQTELRVRVAGLLSKAPLEERITAVVGAFVDAFGPNTEGIWNSVSRPWLSLLRRSQAAGKVEVKAARTLGKALRAPLDTIGVAPSALTPWQLDHYATLVAAAIDAVLVEPNMLKSRTQAEK